LLALCAGNVWIAALANATYPNPRSPNGSDSGTPQAPE
jgi:hypothetical protein